MTNLAFLHPWVLWFLTVALMPLFRTNQSTLNYSSLSMIPSDTLSTAMDWIVRIAIALAVFALVVALSQPYTRERFVERLGTGAQIVLLLDRSASMNANFSGSYLGSGRQRSKAAVARKMLIEFVDRRKQDMFAMISFSTSPTYVLPLTQNHQAVQAAIRSSTQGKGLTNLAPALSMALDFFREREVTGSRIILLVSDGATILEPEIRESLKQMLHQTRVGVYWIYLRTQNAANLDRIPKNINERTSPELFVHRFFQTSGIPYHAYQAENPNALKQAIDEIGQLENKPIQYLEKVPKKDVSKYCYGLALACLLIILAFKAIEIRSWPD